MAQDIYEAHADVPTEWIGDRTVPEIALEELGLALSGSMPARFERTGWTAEGFDEDWMCRTCGAVLLACRKPYFMSAGQLMRYWAFVCAGCRVAWSRNQLNRPSPQKTVSPRPSSTSNADPTHAPYATGRPTSQPASTPTSRT